MGLDCTVFVEAKIDGVWTHLTAFSLKRDFELFTRLGYNDNERSNTTPPEEWSTVSKWLFREVGGGCPQTVDFETFRKLGEQRRLERPNQFDLRPGWAPEFAEWLGGAVQEDPPLWFLSDFIGRWPHGSEESLGTEIRFCVWFG